jgi:UDP-N-acetyl-D-mannosaminuronic acid dehydrogenase
MIVSVLGLGYIGLPTAAVLASRGVEVVGVDVNQGIVDTINQGRIHIVETGLDLIVKASVNDKTLKATTQVEKADVFVIAVPTPFKNNYKPDLSYIKSAVKSIATVLEAGNLVILESTSPVGTTERIIDWIKEERYDLSLPEYGKNNIKSDIFIAHCPERVLPGNVLHELVYNDRVIGGVTLKCAKKARDFYKIFVKADCFLTDCRTAELSKLTENSFRDVNIAFANELSIICDKLDINVWDLIKFANRHPRVNILQPGPGVGGHCIAVDPWFIVDSAPNEARLIHMARLVNDSKPNFVLDKINQAITTIDKDISELSIACLGLAFKPDIDDLRESPALEIAQKINLMGFRKQYLIEPNINNIPKGFTSGKVELVDHTSALSNSDLVVLLVDHTLFKTMDLGLLSNKQVIDTRGIFT